MIVFDYVIMLFLLFFVKHFIIDFLMQPPYMYLNKGKFMHPGGLWHAYLHGVATVVTLVCFGWAAFGSIDFLLLEALGLGALDMVIHYFVDYAKVNVNKKYGWLPNTSENFWFLLGFDQLLHMLTYVLVIRIYFKLIVNLIQ